VLDHLHDDRRGGVGSDAAVLDEGDDGDLGVVGGGVGGEPRVVLGGVEALEGARRGRRGRSAPTWAVPVLPATGCSGRSL
jgi:hypothetical protein